LKKGGAGADKAGINQETTGGLKKGSISFF